MFEKISIVAIHAAGVLLASVVLVNAANAEPAPDLVLRGTIVAAEHQTYRLVPFDVPAGVHAIEIRFDYSGREARTTIDLGLLGPADSFDGAFRGWSGGNKRAFGISANDATPSYLAGPVTPGRWKLLLGIPNIRAGVTAQFTAEVYFARGSQRAGPLQPPVLKSEAGWYRGDLHMHSGHSDGNCVSKSGQQRVPCPLFLTLNAAAERGLDFVAVTEHNTNSHVRELTATQAYFDRLLLISGIEVTTFQGHANAFNLREPIDFRVGSTQVPDWNTLLATLAARGVVVSINHPNAPSGEVCMGCGWLPRPAADLSRLQAVEVVNGHHIETPTSGIPFWHEHLQKGYRLTGIGGSDVHDVTSKDILPPPARIGVPTTVVYAKALGVEAILEGIQSGNVFIDTAGTPDRGLEFSARIDSGPASRIVAMGGELALRNDEQAAFSARVRNVSEGRIEIIRDGAVLQSVSGTTITNDDHQLSFVDTGDGASHWLRINVRDRDGRLVLIGNPIYINRPR